MNLDEKAKAMGYSASELRSADGKTDEELAVILGLAMDRRAMKLLFSVAESSRRGLPHSVGSRESLGVPTLSAEDTGATPEERQAMVSEWVATSSHYTKTNANRMTRRDWETQ